VADVVLLPLCIYEQIERTTWKEADFIPRLDDSDPEVRRKAAAALGGLEGTSHATVEALTKALGDADARVRYTALSSLGELGPRSASAGPAIVERLRDPDSEVRARAATALGEVGFDSSLVIPALIDALHDPAGGVRCHAVQSLAKVGGGAQPVRAALQGCSTTPWSPSVTQRVRLSPRLAEAQRIASPSRNTCSRCFASDSAAWVLLGSWTREMPTTTR
jgi:hypothetical protein